MRKDEIKELREDYSPPPHFMDGFKGLSEGSRPPFEWVFIGPPGARTLLHEDIWRVPLRQGTPDPTMASAEIPEQEEVERWNGQSISCSHRTLAEFVEEGSREICFSAPLMVCVLCLA